MKKLKETHTAGPKKLETEYHGTAIKNNVGRYVDSYLEYPSMKKKQNVPPKSLA